MQTTRSKLSLQLKPSGRDAVMDSNYIRCINSVKRYFAIVIDDDGNFVRDGSPRIK